MLLLDVWRLITTPVLQDPRYHLFADQQALSSVPHFANVMSNIPFLLVAAYGMWRWRKETWSAARAILLAGIAAVGLGSAYYHLAPSNETLFWDRLPMAVVFMTIVAQILRERTGRDWLWPLLGVGVASVAYWRMTGDLRLYALVQFVPMVGLPVMMLRKPGRDRAVWLMLAFYVVAKLLEHFDAALTVVMPMGGHPWKHVAAAVALLCYVQGSQMKTAAPAEEADAAAVGFDRLPV